jgi:hypothetical protein
VALIDWKGCGRGRRLDDLGYMAWTWCIQSVGNVAIEDQADHLRQLVAGYAHTFDAEELLDAITRSQTRVESAETAVLDDPRAADSDQTRAREAIAWAQADRALIERNQAVFAAALCDRLSGR